MPRGGVWRVEMHRAKVSLGLLFVKAKLGGSIHALSVADARY